MKCLNCGTIIKTDTLCQKCKQGLFIIRKKFNIKTNPKKDKENIKQMLSVIDMFTDNN